MKIVAATAQIQLRTSEVLRAWLKEKAQEQDRSVNWLINKIIDDARTSEHARQVPQH